jgi:hypothetical protein
LRRAAWRVRWSRSARFGAVAGRVGVETGREFQVAVLLVEVGGDRVTARDVLVDLRERGRRTIGVSANLSSSSYHSGPARSCRRRSPSLAMVLSS